MRLISMSMLAAPAFPPNLLRAQNASSHACLYQSLLGLLLACLGTASLCLGAHQNAAFVEHQLQGLGLGTLDSAASISASLKLLPLLFAVFGLASAQAAQAFWPEIQRRTITLSDLFALRWFSDLAQSHGLILPLILAVDRLPFQVLDKGVYEALGPSATVFWQEAA